MVGTVSRWKIWIWAWLWRHMRIRRVIVHLQQLVFSLSCTTHECSYWIIETVGHPGSREVKTSTPSNTELSRSMDNFHAGSRRQSESNRGWTAWKVCHNQYFLTFAEELTFSRYLAAIWTWSRTVQLIHGLLSTHGLSHHHTKRYEKLWFVCTNWLSMHGTP